MRTMRTMIVSVSVATIVALSSTSLADPTAEDLFNEGQAEYDRHNFALAVERWQAAYRVAKEPALLFNIAQAYRLANDCESALSTYKRFIAEDPASERWKDANAFVRELELKCRPSLTLEDPRRIENTRPVENARSGQSLKMAGVVAGSGVVLLVTGLVLGKHASTLGDEVTAACSTSCDWAVQKDKDATGHRNAAIGYALDALGVAAIAGGAIMYYLGDRTHPVAVSPRLREGGASISWSGAW